MSETLVVGARGRYERDQLLAAIAEARKTHDVTLQAFDPGAVYGRAHLEAALEKALRAHREARGTANDLATEVACYAAGDAQISKALALVGVAERGDALVLLAHGAAGEQAVGQVLDALGLTRDDAVVREDPGTLDRLGIARALRERYPEERWGELVLERVALLDAGK